MKACVTFGQEIFHSLYVPTIPPDEVWRSWFWMCGTHPVNKPYPKTMKFYFCQRTILKHKSHAFWKEFYVSGRPKSGWKCDELKYFFTSSWSQKSVLVICSRSSWKHVLHLVRKFFTCYISQLCLLTKIGRVDIECAPCIPWINHIRKQWSFISVRGLFWNTRAMHFGMRFMFQEGLNRVENVTNLNIPSLTTDLRKASLWFVRVLHGSMFYTWSGHFSLVIFLNYASWRSLEELILNVRDASRE